MIRSVRVRGFKRFRDAEFRLPGHALLTGANDAGKTTLLQAIASWALALRRWRDVGDYSRRNGYRPAPIARQAFVTVPLRSFDLLWARPPLPWKHRDRDAPRFRISSDGE